MTVTVQGYQWQSGSSHFVCCYHHHRPSSELCMKMHGVLLYKSHKTCNCQLKSNIPLRIMSTCSAARAACLMIIHLSVDWFPPEPFLGGQYLGVIDLGWRNFCCDLLLFGYESSSASTLSLVIDSQLTPASLSRATASCTRSATHHPKLPRVVTSVAMHFKSCSAIILHNIYAVNVRNTT